MKFSVLISVYYPEKPEHLNRCLQSIASQTLMPHEIVIVEDGPLSDGLHIALNNWKTISPYEL
jgi:GT2 family glycosyltransferase